MANADSDATLAPITFETVRDILALEVAEAQKPFVASNAWSIAEAHYTPGAWPRAVIAGGLPVGFLLLFDPTAPRARARGPIAADEIGLWRLMIDHRFQGRGLGRRAVDLALDHARREGRFRRMISSYVAGDAGPERFYLACGFRPTGSRRNEDREIEIARDL